MSTDKAKSRKVLKLLHHTFSVQVGFITKRQRIHLLNSKELATSRTHTKGNRTKKDKNMLNKTLRFSTKTNPSVKLSGSMALSTQTLWLTAPPNNSPIRICQLKSRHFSVHLREGIPLTSGTTKLLEVTAEVQNTTMLKNAKRTR